MNRLIQLAAAGTILAAGAIAQELIAQDMVAQASGPAKANMKMEEVQLRTVGAVRGNTVKGAPYSAEEVNESNQMLADGTRIHRENRTQVYRDSEGRTRRDTPENITITDPVANVTYLLNPKTMTGQKLTMTTGNLVFLTREDRPMVHAEPVTSTFSIHSSGGGPATISVNGMPMDEKQMAEMMAKAKATGSPQTFTYERRVITTDGSATLGVATATSSASSGGGGGGVVRSGNFEAAIAAPRMSVRHSGNGESLGKQTIEGVSAEGMRETSTIPEGAIGNDRAIQTTNESWYSEELQMMVSSKRSDPRNGDETFRLTNIRRGEPGAYLFQPPSGYQISEPQKTTINK
ncbi:MAG: hypothetical protein ABI759_27485 [Candidatus Solibacter sp.]